MNIKSLIKPPVKPFEPLKPPGGRVTLSAQDRLAGARLSSAVARPTLAEALGASRTANITRAKDGTVLGPEGQPLVSTRRADGTHVYVDPNTNQYYVENTAIHYFRKPDHETVLGPYPLPAAARFSNSHFSAADVKELQRLANRPGFIDGEWGRAVDGFSTK